MVSLVNSVAYSNNRTRQKLNSLISDLSVRIRRWKLFRCSAHIHRRSKSDNFRDIPPSKIMMSFHNRALQIKLSKFNKIQVLIEGIKDSNLSKKRSIRRALRSRSSRAAGSTSLWGSWLPGTSPALQHPGARFNRNNLSLKFEPRGSFIILLHV